MPVLTPKTLREQLKKKAAEMGGQSRLARAMGVSPQYLCDVIMERREPGEKTQAYLGVKAVLVYVPVDKPTNGTAG